NSSVVLCFLAVAGLSGAEFRENRPLVKLPDNPAEWSAFCCSGKNLVQDGALRVRALAHQGPVRYSFRGSGAALPLGALDPAPAVAFASGLVASCQPRHSTNIWTVTFRGIPCWPTGSSGFRFNIWQNGSASPRRGSARRESHSPSTAIPTAPKKSGRLM